jgi:Ca2+-binding EF-hand superfamily protein
MTLKGNLSPARVEMVKKAYEKLDMNKDGQVKLDDIAKAFDASNMKDVLMGKRSEQDVYMEYMSLWDTQVKDGIITFDEFLAYYADISCSIDDDDEFVQKMAEAWKL